MAISRNNILIQLDTVSYWYPSSGPARPVLDGIDLTVHSAETIRILGRNGSGKTTLMRLVAGQLQPTLGQRREKRQELRVVYLDQNASNFVAEALTMREQIAVGLNTSFRAPESEKTMASVVDVLRRYNVGLEEHLDVFLAALSGGQRQIVALVSALLAHPHLILLDEFTTYMDSESERISVNLIEHAVHESQIAVLFVSHAVHSELAFQRTIPLS